MRDIKITYNHIKNIRARATTIIKDLEKRDLLDDEIEDEIYAAKSLDALEHLVSGLVVCCEYSECCAHLMIKWNLILVCTIQSG